MAELLRADAIYSDDTLKSKRAMYHDLLAMCYVHVKRRADMGNECVFILPVFAPSSGVMYRYSHVRDYIAKKLRLGGFDVTPLTDTAIYIKWPHKNEVQRARAQPITDRLARARGRGRRREAARTEPAGKDEIIVVT